MERQAIQLRKQIVSRINAVNKIPKERRKKSVDSMQKQYKNATKRMAKLGYTIPPLKDLLKNPNAWLKADLDRKVKKSGLGVTSKSVEQLVDDLYLRTLSRFPDDEEKQISLTFIKDSNTQAAGFESLLWALVNTKEFIISH